MRQACLACTHLWFWKDVRSLMSSCLNSSSTSLSWLLYDALAEQVPRCGPPLGIDCLAHLNTPTVPLRRAFCEGTCSPTAASSPLGMMHYFLWGHQPWTLPRGALLRTKSGAGDAREHTAESSKPNAILAFWPNPP